MAVVGVDDVEKLQDEMADLYVRPALFLTCPFPLEELCPLPHPCLYPTWRLVPPVACACCLAHPTVRSVVHEQQRQTR